MTVGQGADGRLAESAERRRADNHAPLFEREFEIYSSAQDARGRRIGGWRISGDRNFRCARGNLALCRNANRALKALSQQQIEDLRGGRGMGMALVAELNGYPGPAQVIELASALDLSEAQRGRTQALFEEMQKTAMPLGNEVLAKETELDQAFASGSIDDARLHRILADIGRLQGELRYTHLKYHVAMRGVLSLDQIATYDRLRGYDSAQAPAPGMHGGHSH